MSAAHIQKFCDRIERESGCAPVAIVLPGPALTDVTISLGPAARYMTSKATGASLQLANGTGLYLPGQLEAEAIRQVVDRIRDGIGPLLRIVRTVKPALSVPAVMHHFDLCEQEAARSFRTVKP